jgi:ComF family protein
MRALLQLLAPPLCAECGASAGAIEPLCSACRREVRWLGAEPMTIAPSDEASPEPRGGGRSLPAWAPLAYEGPARGVVRALKFKGATRAASAMAAQIVANAPAGWLDPPAELVPVPLHPTRARKRGYNQAERLASAVGARTGLPIADCLERVGPRATQVGGDRAQRLSRIPGTVRLARERSPPPRGVLVDDVITTGATLAACAAVLWGSGTREVVAIAYARTPGR